MSTPSAGAAAIAPASAPPLPGNQGGAPWAAPQYKYRSFFVYELDFNSNAVDTDVLPSGGNVSSSFNIAGDSDFFLTKICVTAAPTSDTPVFGAVPADVLATIINTTTGRQYMSAGVPLANIMGLGGLPFLLPQVTLWAAKSTIQVSLTGLPGSDGYEYIGLSFIGIKAFTS